MTRRHLSMLFAVTAIIGLGPLPAVKALFMTVWRPSTRSAEHSCGIRQG